MKTIYSKEVPKLGFFTKLILKIFGIKFAAQEEKGVSVELQHTYVYDFNGYASQFNRVRRSSVPINDMQDAEFAPTESGAPIQGTFLSTPAGGVSTVTIAAAMSKGYPPTVQIKPIDVLNELETIPTPFSLTMIDEKITLLKQKRELVEHHYTQQNIDGIIQRLENRKKYQEFKSFFDKWENTTQEKIDNLLKKYSLVMKSATIFIPDFPKEAIDAMRVYNENVLKLCGLKAVYYVIATPDSFRAADGKRDPILLAQSPFGMYYQILGAWDEEMMILSEL